jgi:hypothetical protein
VALVELQVMFGRAAEHIDVPCLRQVPSAIKAAAKTAHMAPRVPAGVKQVARGTEEIAVMGSMHDGYPGATRNRPDRRREAVEIVGMNDIGTNLLDGSPHLPGCDRRPQVQDVCPSLER